MGSRSRRSSGTSSTSSKRCDARHLDFVADIDHPQVGPWLERNGLTAEEAAWIQPVYDGNPCVIEPGGGIVCGTDDRSYECEALVVQCAAPVQVRSVGLCPGDGTPDVIGSEICAVESTGGESTGQGSDEAESGTDDDDGDKGCRTGKSPPTAVVMLFIALLRRRRRRW